MTRERIDLEKLNDDLQHGNPEVNISDLIAELKRCYEHMDTLSAIWCNTCEKHFDESDYGINYHRITVPDDSLMYEYREDMQEHCIECMETSEAIEKNCICDLCQQYREEQNASE